MDNTQTEKKEIKYGSEGDFELNGQELCILNEYLTDNPSSFFKITIKDGRAASYTLNDGVPVKDFLSKLDNGDFKKCLGPFDLPNEPKSLQVAAEGALQKRDDKWIVTKKIVIKVS